MRALGIDPGSRVTGWGVVEHAGAGFRELASGTIRLGTTDTLADRLARLHVECLALARTWTPDALVLERNFVAHNVQSAFRIGEVRGVVLAAAAAARLRVHEYAPAAVKLAAVGHGRADKETVGRGVTAILRLGVRPPADAADALAVALCHLQQAPLEAAIARAERSARSRRAAERHE
ncbi:MAG TPA: crossover junction endodeoxyribonuclease RuvC [Candidatus Eisenbacteria bacterium]|nr:crossover junction endodeoxyribonuclease RuvC [Candidatus Eisenbacteria bacterium]